MQLNRDFSDLLSEFAGAKVRFLIVGAYAMALHGRPRTTGDLDIWIDAEPINAARVFDALERFGAPMTDMTHEDFETPHLVFQVGVVPNRIDVLTSLTALRFSEAWKRRRRAHYGSLPVWILSEQDLIRNKRALGRPRDLADVEEMSKTRGRPRRRS